MILKKLEPIRFGKFKGASFDLSSGLTAVQKNNESGKTTLADFIVFIFYGLEKKRGKLPLGENLLEKYQPWDSEEGLCGAAEFTDEAGKHWRIERTQDKKGKGEVRLMDADGALYEAADVGEHFLGVDRETFSNIFYVGQRGQSFRRTEQMDIAMKNLVTTGNEEVGYDTVMKFLSEEKGKYSSPKRDAGKLRRIGAEIEELKRQIALGEAELETTDNDLTAESVEEEIALCEQKLEALAEMRRQAAAFAAQGVRQKRAQLEQQEKSLLKEIEQKMSPLSEEDSSALNTAFAELESAELIARQAKEELRLLQQEPPQMTRREQTILSHEGAAHISSGFAVGAVFLVILGLFGICLGVIFDPYWWLMAAGAVAVLLLLSVCLLRLPRKIAGLGIGNRGELRRELARAKETQQALWQFQRDQAAAVKNVGDREEQVSQLRRKYAPLMERTAIVNRMELEQVRQNNTEAMILQAKLQDLRARLGELGTVAPAQNEVTAPALSVEEMEGERAAWQQKKEQLYRQQAELAARRERAAARRRILAKQREELEDKQGLEVQMQRANRIVMLAMEQMELAQQKLRENYAPLLREAMSAKLSLLTDGKYDQVMLDEELGVRIKADGGMRELAYFSDGTKDAALLALRLSLAEILEGNRSTPLIFDDPFLHLDPRRFEILKTYLAKAALRRQILLLSCREI